MAGKDNMHAVTQRVVVPAERVSNTYDMKIAFNDKRRGQEQAAEGLTARDANLSRTFGEGFRNARAATEYSFEAQPAGQRSPLAGWQRGLAQPAWANETTDAVAGDFAAAALEQRGPNLTERGRQTYGKTYAPGTRTTRRNEAEVHD